MDSIQQLQAALEYSREQLFQAELKLDQVTETELIDAAIFEQRSWEERCKFYNRKLREAVRSGQALPSIRHIQPGGRR